MYLLRYMDFNIYPFGWLKLLAPVAVLRWIISYEIFTNTAICVLFSICMATSVVALIFFGSQSQIALLIDQRVAFLLLIRLKFLKAFIIKSTLTVIPLFSVPYVDPIMAFSKQFKLINSL
ncbi:unnamed protein product [Brugia timori]|uniref:ABC transmembrane type-1 domain-containing protein n=1 Tax=Brugia timori TaxID=42155 RepID=A0A0R3R5T5_9BILA|nr:unnamed protein product [Brugia timori]